MHHARRWLIISVLLLFSVAPVAAESSYWLAFQTNVEGSDDIFIMRADGLDVRNLTPTTASDRHPDWSPDGLRIVFASDRSGNDDLYLMDNNGENVENLTQNSANDSAPSWSPDGRRIAFVSDRTGGFDLFTIEIATRQVEALTTDASIKSAPAWSPDGRQIAYWQGAEGAQQILVLDLATRTTRTLTTPGGAVWPAWSPDGSRIAYFQPGVNGQSDIFVYDLTTDRVRNLTNDPSADVRPAFAPDGSITFASNRDGNIELYQMGPDGEQPRRLTFNDAEQTSPAWQRLPAGILPTQASAVVEQNGLILSSVTSMTSNAQVSSGQGRLFAPEEPVTTDDLILIRMEIEANAPAFPTRPLDTRLTPTPLIERGVDVYAILGAELTGVDLERFRVEPTPTDYVLRLDLEDVNYWEWTLRARDANTIGVNYLGVRVYAPLPQPDGTIAEETIFNERFTVEVINAQTAPAQPVFSGDPAPLLAFPTVEPAMPTLFGLSIDAEKSLTLITLGETDLSTLTFAGAGHPYGEYAIERDFASSLTQAWTSGNCFVYFTGASDYRVPRACTGNIYELGLPNSDRFWYDDRPNVQRHLIIRFAGRTFHCPNTASSCSH